MQIAASIIFTISVLVCLGNAKTNSTDALTQLSSTTDSGDCSQFYTVVSGDTAFVVATKRGLLLSEIQSYNPGVNLDAIDVGQQLCINQAGRIPPSNPDGLANVVLSVSGQTCEDIARENNITVKVITDLNSFSCEQPLGADVRVYVTRGLNPTCDRFYTIIEGDTATTIASSNGLTLSNLQQLNPGMPVDPIVPGYRFCVAGDGIGSKTSTVVSTAAPSSTPTPVICTSTYTVVSGDTAYRIALPRGMTLTEIAALNPDIPDLNVLAVGQNLCLNQVGAIPPSKPDGFATSVTSNDGDTCQALAKQNDISDSVFKILNGALNCDAPLSGGQTVFVTRGFTPSCKKFHTIVKGETASGIATDSSITLDQLQLLNPGLSVSVIFPDERFCVA